MLGAALCRPSHLEEVVLNKSASDLYRQAPHMYEAINLNSAIMQ